MNEPALRRNVVELMNGGHAHLDAKSALRGVSARARNARPAPHLHTIWEELEHLRIAQEDILRYTLDPRWKSPKWPAGYWPKKGEKADAKAWSASVRRFLADLDELVAIAKDPSRDLTTEIPNGEGRTYLRQLLLAADHNAYHLGQIVLLRKLLGDMTA